MPPTIDEIKAYIAEAALAHGLQPALLVAQCKAESAFNPEAVSRCGAIGLFQLMPPTATELDVDPHDWKQNVLGAVGYMEKLLKVFSDDYEQALAAYNWGIGHMRRNLIEHGAAWRDHLPVETKQYLARIMPAKVEETNV